MVELKLGDYQDFLCYMGSSPSETFDRREENDEISGKRRREGFATDR